MKPEHQIKALAELANIKPDRIEGTRCYKTFPKRGSPDDEERLLIDFNSFDSIIPLIQKMPDDIREKVCEYWYSPLSVKPSQLCEALLRATNKWIES